MRCPMPREFYIKKDSTKITREGLDAEVYLYENGKLCAMGFIAKQSKPAFHFAFRTEEQRTKHVDEFFASRQKSQEFKENRQKEKREFVTSLKVGDVLHGSWGYDQTNPEFAEVVEVIGPRCVMIREIAQVSDPNTPHGMSSMSENVLPVPGKYTSEPVRRIVSPGDCVKFNEHCYMSKTDPNKSHYNSWYA